MFTFTLRYQCYSLNTTFHINLHLNSILFRSIQPDNDYLMHLYYSDIDLLSSSSDLINLFVNIHSNMNQSDEFYGLDKYFQNRPYLSGEFHQLNNNHYDALFYYDQAALKIDSSKFIQSLRLCGFNHILEQYLHQMSSLSDSIFYRIQLTSLLTTGQTKLTQWKTSDEPSSNHTRDDILSIIRRQMRAPSSSSSSSSISQIIDHNLWLNVSDLRECSLINIIDDMIKNYENPEILSRIWMNQFNNSIIEEMFDQNDEILLTCVATTHKLLLNNNNDNDNENLENRNIKQKLFADLVTQLCRNALNAKKLQVKQFYFTISFV